MPDKTVARYRRQVDELAAALKMIRHAEHQGPPRPASVAVTCGCITFRAAEAAAAEWLEAACAVCGRCGRAFTRKAA